MPANTITTCFRSYEQKCRHGAESEAERAIKLRVLLAERSLLFYLRLHGFDAVFEISRLHRLIALAYMRAESSYYLRLRGRKAKVLAACLKGIYPVVSVNAVAFLAEFREKSRFRKHGV